jgi:hypothetical protein
MIPLLVLMIALSGNPTQPTTHARHFELQDTLGPIHRPSQPKPKPDDGGPGGCNLEPNGGPNSCACVPNSGYNCPDGQPCPPSGLCKP